MPNASTEQDPNYEQQLRDMNEALLISSVHLHEQTEKAEEVHAALEAKEKDLRISDRRFRVAVDAINSLLWTNNARGEMEGEQPDWEKFTGQTREEYRGFGWANAVHPDDAQPTIDAWNMAVRRKETFVFEHRLRNRLGKWRVCSIRAVPMLTDEGEVSEWVGVHTDITERKETEEELRRSREELETRVVERTAQLVSANEKFRRENQKRLRAEEQRVGILRRLTSAQEDERRNISLDLHDGVGQQITALRFKLDELRRKCGPDDPLLETVLQIQDYAERIDAAVDSVSYELRPAGLEVLGLRASLNDFVRHWSDYHGIPAEFHSSQSERKPLSPEANSHLYRIVQEALNNVLKHAKATSVSVLLSFQDGNLILIIEDNGVGFEPVDIRKAASRRGGLGLVGMRERCHLLGGQMSIESGAGKGTVILCRIPVEAAG